MNLGLHPHTVSCYYVRRVDGVPRVFAEFVDGGSLYEWIRDGRLRAVDQILDVAIQFAWGLHYAHDQGLVHRDVKPANLMLTTDGAAKVTDFGLTRARAMSAVAGRRGCRADADGGGRPRGHAGVHVARAVGGPRPDAPHRPVELGALRARDVPGPARRGSSAWRRPTCCARTSPRAPSCPACRTCRPLVADLVQRCFHEDPDARPRSLWEAATVLYAAYEAATGHAYPRPEPQAGKDTADSLNNRAVSLLDLGREAEADPLWGRALRSQPHHLEATYNQVLRDWQAGGASDEEMLTRMGEAGKTHASSARVRQLLGRLQFAVGDYPAAAKSFEDAVGAGVRSTELYRELGLALCAQGATAPDAAQPWVRATECLAGALQAGGEDPAEIAGYALSLVRLGQEEKGRGLYRQAAQQRRGLPAELQDAVARFLPGHEAGLTLKGLVRPAIAVVVTPDGAAGARERRREHPLLGCRDRDVPARAARARRARARAGPDRRRHAPAVGRRGDAAAAPRPRDRTHAAVDAAPHGLRHGARHDARRHARGVGRLRPRRPRVGPGDRASACRRCRGIARP